MLESSGFDFRNRHPQEFLIKLAKFYNFQRSSAVVRTAYVMTLDLYRTFAPLKQQTATMAFACLELAGRLLGEEHQDIWRGKDYATWRIDRGMVMGMSPIIPAFGHRGSEHEMDSEADSLCVLTSRNPARLT